MTGFILFAALLFQMVQMVQTVQAGADVFPATPPGPGTWLLQNGAWLTMVSAPVAGTNAKSINNYIYTGGYTNLDMDVSFAGSKAVLRVSGREPVFMARPNDDGFEPVLVRLEKKKDRRVCRARPSSASADNKHGFRKQNIVRTVLTINADKSFIVRPERPLKPGEYLLVTGSPSFGRDFGVD